MKYHLFSRNLAIVLIAIPFIISLYPFTLNSQNRSLEEGYIEVDHGKLYCQLKGNGQQTIVFIHDGMVHHVVWDGQFDFFAEDYTVVRYDRRGYGRSPQPDTLYSNVEDLNRVFEQLDI